MALDRRHWLAGAGAAGLAGVAALLWRRHDSHLAQLQSAAQQPFALLDGRQVRLADWHGRVLLLNFWATSCSTCVAEMPLLAAVHQQFSGPRFDTLAVAMAYDPPEQVRAFATSRALPFSVGLDRHGDLAQALGPVVLTPTSLLLDPSGRLQRRYLGAPDPQRLKDAISGLLTA